MKKEFAGLQLGPALFYRWDAGIRFELNRKHLPDVRLHFDEILQRATALYESVFLPGNRGFIVSGYDFEFTPKGERIPKMREFSNSVFDLSLEHDLGLPGIAGRQRFTSYRDLDSRIISTLNWAAIDCRRIGYRKILQAVMYKDFWRAGRSIDDYVYFVNVDRNMILHMYDDRGLDILASNLDGLRPIYRDFNDWILDYDRPQIDQRFAGCSTS